VEYAVSREIVQRVCDERADLVPYLQLVIDSLETHRGLYQEKLANRLPLDVISELDRWMRGSEDYAKVSPSDRMEADLQLLERMFLGIP
jgi:hypothetical protein